MKLSELLEAQPSTSGLGQGKAPGYLVYERMRQYGFDDKALVGLM